MFFLWLLSFIQFNTYDVMWKHQVVEIPLNEEVSPYALLPEVEVYQDGKKIEGLSIYYQRGVDRTFLSVVHSREVKTFYIKYRVYIPSIGYDNIDTITFVIVDTIAPEIIASPFMSFPIGSKINLLDHLQFSDNYYSKNDLEIHLDSSKLDISKVGTYEVSVIVSDPSSNRSERTIQVRIYDHIAPEVSVLKPIVLNPNTLLDIHQFIKVKDNIDTVFITQVEDIFVSYHVLGVYPITIIVSDQSLNVTKIHTTIEIKDTVPPSLRIVSNTPIIEVNTDISMELLKTYIVELEDNFDLDVTLEITDDINPYVIGQYTIYFSAKDQSGNTTEKTLKVWIKDTTAPKVEPIQPLIFDVFGSLKPWITYFIIEDNVDPIQALDIQIKEKVKVETIGSYPLDIEVTDRSKNSFIYRFIVEIVDRTPPTLTYNDIVVTEFLRPDYKSILGIEDQYDRFENILIHVHDQNIDYQSMGSYTIEVILQDLSLNQSVFMIELFIVDIVPPEIILKTDVLFLSIPVTSFDPYVYIDLVEDNQDSHLKEVVTITSHVLFEPGRYDVIYQVYDRNMLFDEAILIVYVIDNVPPKVSATPLKVQRENTIDLFSGIEVLEDSNYQIIVLNAIDYTVTNTQIMYYVIYDENGNETFFQRELMFDNNDRLAYIKPYIFTLSTVFIGSLSSFLAWYRYNRRVFDNSIDFKYNKHTKSE